MRPPSARDPGKRRHGRGSATRGQSLVEFALIFPILIMLLVLIADFGRVFAAGVVVEAAARDAAEVAALEYLQNPPGPTTIAPADRLMVPAPDPGDPGYYGALATRAARTACSELRVLPNTTYDSGTGTCPDWPVIRVCVHDGVSNNGCGDPVGTGFESSTPAECSDIPPPGDVRWTSAQAGGTETSRYVEVAVCYPFTSILNTPVLPFATLYIQRTRVFSVACFLDPAVASC